MYSIWDLDIFHARTRVYLHENIKANGKTYMVPVYESSTRSNFCNQLGITFNKFPATVGLRDSGGVGNAAGCGVDGSLRRRFEHGLHLPPIRRGNNSKRQSDGLEEKKKDPWGLVLKLKFNSLFYKSHLFWKSCEPFGAQLILCTHISQKQWKRMLDSWSGFLLYTNWTQSGDDWREERFYFNNWNP